MLLADVVRPVVEECPNGGLIPPHVARHGYRREGSEVAGIPDEDDLVALQVSPSCDRAESQPAALGARRRRVAQLYEPLVAPTALLALGHEIPSARDHLGDQVADLVCEVVDLVGPRWRRSGMRGEPCEPDLSDRCHP